MALLTVDSEELNGNYSGFSERKIQVIKETFVLFQHFNFISNELYGITLKVNGCVFGKPEYVYYVKYINRNKGDKGYICLDIQPYKVDKEGRESILFGVNMYTYPNTGKKEYIAYHHSMAPDYDDEI